MERSEGLTKRGADGGAHAARFGLLVMLFLFIFTHRGIQGQNDLSRFVAVDSLANRGVLYIDDSPWAQVKLERQGRSVFMLNDMVRNPRDGHFYSSKPPVLTLILAGVLKGFQLIGARFEFFPLYKAAKPAFLLTWLVIGTVSALGFYAFRRQVARFTERAEGDMVTAMTLGGTLFLSYSTTMNHHTFTAALVLMCFFALGMAEGSRDVLPGRAALGGFMMGLAAVVDIGPGVIFSVAFALYLAFRVRSWLALALFALAAVPPVAAHCVVQYGTFGTILPVQLIRGVKQYAGSYWQAPLPPDSWRIPRWKYWLLTLFSARGLFVLSPILLVGAARLAEVIRDAWRGRAVPASGPVTRGYAALTVLFGIGLLFIYYGFIAGTNFCGACFGMRWYIGFVPLLAFYAAEGYGAHAHSARFRNTFYVLGLISLMYALVGMQEPWTLMENNPHPAVQALMLLRGF